MVNTHPALAELIASCTLLNMRGIIPSQLDLQQQLQQKITCYSRYLADKGYPVAEVNALHRLMCRVIDRAATGCLAAQGLSWNSYQLAPGFYGHYETDIYRYAHSQLLLGSANEEINGAALTLYTLSPQPLPGSAQLPVCARQVAPVEADAEEMAAIDEPVSVQAADTNAVWRWRRPLFQLLISGLLLGLLWYGCRTLLSGGL
ncbi:hypothetical protein ACWXWB_14015 [Pantoea dispersa]|uniref:hypothetical protein n=1 Tax=Pantoea dispersa TaxID=59814 RepID=UPI002DBC053A|nr:hypothetical protein [Pantoea dispersa]MEB5973378.1 hypothetical protein [Pantoea dispersa]